MFALHHVQLAMPKGGEDRARAFYRDLLGLHEVAKPPVLAARGGCWFRGGALELHLGVEDDFAPARKAHPALRCDDLDALLGRLESAGVDVRPETELPGFRRAYIDDPFGNRVELLAPLPEERRAGEALAVVLDVLDRHGVAHQIGGGLAARAWGATRPLVDLDLWVPFPAAAAALEELQPRAVVPEGRSPQSQWDASLIVHELVGCRVELLDATSSPRYRTADGGWEALDIRFDASVELPVLGRRASIMPRAQLAEVKRRMDREVDRLDLAALEAPPRAGKAADREPRPG